MAGWLRAHSRANACGAIGVLMNLAAEDPVSIARAKAFAQGLQALGWVDGRNVQIDYRWAAGKADFFSDMQQNLWRLRPTSS